MAEFVGEVTVRWGDIFNALLALEDEDLLHYRLLQYFWQVTVDEKYRKYKLLFEFARKSADKSSSGTKI